MENKKILCKPCDKAFIGIVILDNDYKILELNKEIERRGNISISKIIGSNFLSYIIAEDRNKVKKVLDSIRHEKEEDAVITKLLTPEGTTLWVNLVIRKIKDALLVNIIDLSKIIQMEKSIEEKISITQVLIESIQDGVIVIDDKGTIQTWNSGAERIFGYEKDEIIGKDIRNTILPKRFYEEYKERFANLLKNGESRITGKLINIHGKRKDGTELPLETSVGTVKINERWHAVVVVRDISERIKRERELTKEKDELIFLYKFMNKISSTLEPEKIFEIGYEELTKILENMDAFLVALIDEKNNRINVEFVVGEGKKFKKHSTELNDRDTITGWVALHGKELYIKNVNKDKLPAGIKVIGYPMLSWVGFPLKYRDKVVGVLSVQSKKENAFSDRDLRILRLIADNFAMVTSNAELYKELKLREELYSSIAKTPIVGVVTTDMERRFTYVNNYFANMLGYSPEDIIGRKITDFTTEKGKKIMIKGTERRKKGISDSYKAEFLSKDGRVIPVLIYASPIRNFKGNISGTVGIIIDISETEAMKEKLDMERKKYKTLFENVATGIAIIQDKLIVYTNKEMAKILGLPPEMVMGAHVSQFIHPDSLKIMMDYYNSRLRDMATSKQYISKLINRDGRAVWCNIKASKIDWEGKPAVMTSITDITHLKETEDTLIALDEISRAIKKARTEEKVFNIIISGIKSIMHFSDVSVLKVQGNKVVMTLFAWKNKTPSFSEINMDRKKSIVAWVARNGESYYAPNTKKDPLYMTGDTLMLSEYTTPMLVNGKVYAVLDVQSAKVDGISSEERMMLDMLSAQVGTTLENLKYQKELEASRNLQELMLHIVSHDLKNPLAVISGYIELLKEEHNPEFLDEMEKAVERANEIIKRARLFSKLDMKKISQEKKNIKISELVEKAYETVKDKYPGKSIAVKGDAELQLYPIMEEVFVNLIDNAFKYGAEKVEVKIEKGEEITIKVADDGEGIPDKQKEIIFEAFEKLSNKGSGLGLAIVKKIVELHDGKVWVKDNKPKGSVFIIKLPYTK